MRNNLNIIQNLYKIRDSILESNDNVNTIVNFLSSYGIQNTSRYDEWEYWFQFQRTFPEDAQKMLDSDETPINVVDPFGLFTVTFQRIENAGPPFFNVTLHSGFDENGNPQFSSNQVIGYNVWWGQDQKIDYIDQLVWEIQRDSLSDPETISGVELLRRISEGSGLNQSVLLVNDLILQNGTASMDSIIARLNASGLSDNPSVQQLIVNISAQDKLTSQAWVTILYQMYYDNKTALDNNSLVLDTSKLNVIQGFMIFGTTEIITTVLNIFGIMLAAVTKGLSLLIGYLVQSFNHLVSNYKERGEFRIDVNSSNAYFDIPIMAWKRPVNNMRNPEKLMSTLFDNGYAKYIPTPFADYYFWINDGQLYANAFLKLGASPNELQAFGDLGQDAICGLEHLRASADALDGANLLSALSNSDQICKAFSTSVLGFIFQNMIGYYNRYDGDHYTGHYGLNSFFRGAIVNFSAPIPDGYNLIIKEGPSYSGTNLSGEWILPSTGIGYVAGLIAQSNGAPSPSRVSEIYRVLQAVTNYCNEYSDGTWSMSKSYLPSLLNNPSLDQEFGLKIMHPMGTTIAETISYRIDIQYYNTQVIPPDTYNSIEWYGNCPNDGFLTRRAFDKTLSPYPSNEFSAYYLWSDIWANEDFTGFDESIALMTDVDSLPNDRLVTSPTIDVRSVSAALLIVGAATIIAIVAGTIVTRKITSRKMARSLDRKATLDQTYKNYCNSSGDEKIRYRNQLIDQTRRYNRIASILGWRQYDFTSGSFVPLGSVSNGSASLFNSLSDKIFTDSSNSSSEIKDKVDKVLERIGE